MKVLIVEDDTFFCEMLTAILSNLNYVVEVATDGEQAWNLIECYEYDLIILDVSLAKIDGITLYDRIGTTGLQTPILLTIGCNDNHEKAVALNAGADDFVSKSSIIEPEVVTSILNRLERSHQQRKHEQADMRKTKRMLKTLSTCYQALVRAENELELSQNICRIITEVGNYQSIWIGFIDNTSNNITPVAQTGFKQGYIESLNLILNSDNTQLDKLSNLAITAINTAKTCMLDNERTPEVYVAAISIPLISNSKAFGVINICANEPDAFDAESVKQFEQLAADIAYGIISLRQKQQCTAELVRANKSLQCELESRLEMQEALRNSQALFTGIVSIADNAIISIDDNQCISLFNSGAEKIFGYQASEVLGKPLAKLLPERYIQEHRRHVADFKQSPNTSRKMAERREVYGKRKDGTVFPAEASISKLELGSGIVYTVYLQDISDRKQIERMKNEFISIVSHELRTPLTSIHGSLGMLASGLMKPDSEQSKRLLKIATDSTERLVKLTNDILDIERIESGRVKMSKQICNAADLVSEAVNVIQGLADKANITLSITCLPINVWVDSDRIVQTLTSLLNNAIKFSKPNSTVWLEAKQQDNEVLFIVKDNGRGIPEDKLEVIFEGFRQLDSSDARRQDGTGLGLAICKSIIQQHDGSIWVESTLGEGSTFYFTIPSRM